MQLPVQEQQKSASKVLISFLHILVASYQVTGYDTDQKIAEAFEYLKLLPEALQKEVALELIKLLQEEESN